MFQTSKEVIIRFLKHDVLKLPNILKLFTELTLLLNKQLNSFSSVKHIVKIIKLLRKRVYKSYAKSKVSKHAVSTFNDQYFLHNT